MNNSGYKERRYCGASGHSNQEYDEIPTLNNILYFR
jgi:hypothetical protein